jgi:hypothetical protein
MSSLKNIFSHRSQTTEWQDEVIARLDLLVASQNKLRQELADHVVEGQPTRGAARADLSISSLLYF